METEITDPNCIVKAFQNKNISIIKDKDNKYYFRGSDVAKALEITNVRSSIQNFTNKEKGVRKVDTLGGPQDIIFLSSHGVYRLLYSSKKKIAERFREWVGDILDDIIFNESTELKRQLQEQKALLLEKDETIKQLENKPETCGFERLPGYIYFVEDTTKPGHIKLGYATTPNNRVSSLNVASSTYSLKILATFETFDKEFAEKIIHCSLNPFRIKNRKEWFYFKNENEMIYALNTVKNCIEFIKNFDINEVKEVTDINLQSLLIDINKVIVEKSNQIKEIQKENSKKTNKNSIQQSGAQTGIFKGACWVTEKSQWCAQLQHNYKNTFLGYFPDEIDAAKVYNDYAAYLNQTENTNFYLNDIPGYITVSRNVPEENKKQINEKKTSKYTGVSYDSKRKYYVAGIKLAGKTFNLGNNQQEIECVKLYNQQALFFNNTLNTKYILNDIPNYITLPKDFRNDIINNKNDKLNKKSSQFHGVCKVKPLSSITTAKKWTASYMLNRKKIHIGTFNTEKEACEEYNKKVIELNKNGCNYKVNIISIKN